ncbi:MAG: 2'-5' RNA ligase family protein [Ginsengibacter sp.]
MKQATRLQEFAYDSALKKESHSVAEYLLVLQPHEALWKEIVLIKEKFAKDFDCEMARAGLPYITLATFKQYQATETHIRQALRNSLKTLEPFKIEMKGFGCFPSHTIYINIVSKVQIMHTVKVARQGQRFMKIDKNTKPYFITDPHLTIARKLLPWQYEKGWLEYQQTDFHERFIADHALLLKRKQGERYKPVEKFLFQNKKEEITQRDLFTP